jgi:hypothetical protein
MRGLGLFGRDPAGDESPASATESPLKGARRSRRPESNRGSGSVPFRGLRWFCRGIHPPVVLLLFFGCATLPEISPVVPLESERGAARIRACEGVFPPVPARFVHSVETDFGGGRKGMMLGVTLVRPGERKIRAVLMTIEGLVMFDGRWEAGNATIDRGVPPLDSPHFARGLLEDIGLVFLPPEGTPTAVGFAEDGAPVCRYERDGRETVDVIAGPDGAWRIHRYAGARRTRTVRAESAISVPGPEGPFSTPRKIALTAKGRAGAPDYALSLTLLEAEAVGGPRKREIPERGETGKTFDNRFELGVKSGSEVHR